MNARDGFTCRQRVISRYMRYQEPAHTPTPSHLAMRMLHAPTARGLISPGRRGGTGVLTEREVLPGADGRSVAAQDLGLVLVPGDGGAVGFEDEGPALAVDRDLVVVPASRTQLARLV